VTRELPLGSAPELATVSQGPDVGSAVDFTYKPPLPFTRKIEKVTMDLK
jgi:hypothetical protein